MGRVRARRASPPGAEAELKIANSQRVLQQAGTQMAQALICGCPTMRGLGQLLIGTV